MNEFLIIEGEEATAEYTFWKDVIRFPGTILYCKGNTAIFKVLEAVEGLLCDGAKIYVCYDTINKYSTALGKTVKADLCLIENKLRNFMTNFKVSCYLLKDLCFESMLLRLIDILPNTLNKDERALQQFIIKEYVNLIPITQLNQCSVFSLARSKAQTNEAYAADVLHTATKNTHFCVTKGNLDRCWVVDCGYKTINSFKKCAYYAKEISKVHICCSMDMGNMFCGHLFSDMLNKNLFEECKKGYKRDIILKSLCNSDWHKLFLKVV